MDSSSAEERRKGRQPAVPKTAQKSVTTKNPSLVLSSVFDRAVGKNKTRPIINVMRNELTNTIAIPSLYPKDTANGRKLLSALNNISKRPRILTMIEACII